MTSTTTNPTAVPGGLRGHVTNPAHQPDLSGHMTPMADELDVTGLAVSGELPPGLRGSFVRNGPNPLFDPIGRYNVLDGDGMLHGVTVGDGAASYRNRWVRSRGLQAELVLGRAIYPGLGNVMDFPDRSLTRDAGPVKNVANTHIIRHAGRYLALWEGGLPTEVTPTLDTVGEHDFGGRLRGAMTAHPRIDPRTGELVCFAYSLFPPYLHYFVVDASGDLVHSVDLDLPAPVMMHDFVITEDHAVFLDSPIVFNMESLGNGPMTSWRPENGTRLGVLPRRGGADDITWYEIEPGHVQHFWSGWAEGDRIELCGSRFDAPDFGIDSDSPLDQVGRRPDAGSACPVLDRPGARHRRVGAHRRPGRRLQPHQRRPQRRAGPLAVPVGRPAVRAAHGRLRHHREVRRDRRQPDDVDRRPPRPRRRERVRPRPRRHRRGRRLAAEHRDRRRPPTPATWSCSTPATWPPGRWPPCTSPAGCRSGSTPAGSPSPEPTAAPPCRRPTPRPPPRPDALGPRASAAPRPGHRRRGARRRAAPPTATRRTRRPPLPATSATTTATSAPEREPGLRRRPRRRWAPGAPTSASTSRSGGADRWYSRLVPTAYDGAPVPLVIDLHGYLSGAAVQAEMSQLGATGEEAGFVVATPQGTSDMPYWNAVPMADLPDDVGFVEDVIDDVGATLCIDPARVYVDGFSNGAFLTSLVACRLSDRVAAVAAVAGLLLPADCDPTRPVPVLAIHGTDDRHVSFDGAPNPALDELTWNDESRAAFDGLAFGRGDRVRRGLGRAGRVRPRARPHRGRPTPSSSSRTPGAPTASAVELYVVDGGGHAWPGSDALRRQRVDPRADDRRDRRHRAHLVVLPGPPDARTVHDRTTATLLVGDLPTPASHVVDLARQPRTRTDPTMHDTPRAASPLRPVIGAALVAVVAAGGVRRGRVDERPAGARAGDRHHRAGGRARSPLRSRSSRSTAPSTPSTSGPSAAARCVRVGRR